MNTTELSAFIGKKILYVAPELPSLSATFVYNEIFKLSDLGADIACATVHTPVAQSSLDTKKALGAVFNIYQQAWHKRLKAMLSMIVKHPVYFMQTLGWLIKDVINLGLFNRLAAGQVFRFMNACVLAKYALEVKAEHIHTHFAHIPTDITMYAANMAQVPFSFTAHANDIFERGWLLVEKIDRCKFAVTISDYNKRFLGNIPKLKTDKVHVIHCGVDSTAFPLVDHEVQTVFTFGFLARLVEKKGCKVLIKAAFELKKITSSFKVVIVGDGPLSRDLSDLIVNLKLSDNVTMHGPMPNSDVPRWFKMLNAFVLPSVIDSNGDMDGIPVSLMEAMSSGIPVISTDVSGVKELVVANKTGLLVESNCEYALVGAMLQIKGMSEQELRHLAETAKFHVQALFDQSNNAQALARLIVSP